jgi:hypothetical protein
MLLDNQKWALKETPPLADDPPRRKAVDNIEKRGINLKSRTDAISERVISSSADDIYPARDIVGIVCVEHNRQKKTML